MMAYDYRFIEVFRMLNKFNYLRLFQPYVELIVINHDIAIYIYLSDAKREWIKKFNMIGWFHYYILISKLSKIRDQNLKHLSNATIITYRD